ncbi:helix-turn-helix domain-containing protein [Paralcaligenes ureilyticus]|nr:helix-turn-helix transcriptional regulator [Paralcaligenes ureilyticus]
MDIAEKLSSGIGQKLRQRRKVRQMSLKDVAEKANVSIAFLSQIERNLSIPSLRTLDSICAALDMPIGWLFGRDGKIAPPEEEFIVRADARRRLDFMGMTKEILSSDSVTSFQLMRFVIYADGQIHDSPIRQLNGAKGGMVLAGQFGLELNGCKYLLDRNDSFSFAIGAPFRFWCAGSEDCEIIWAVTPAVY